MRRPVSRTVSSFKSSTEVCMYLSGMDRSSDGTPPAAVCVSQASVAVTPVQTSMTVSTPFSFAVSTAIFSSFGWMLGPWATVTLFTG